jgi:hypothetical protein
LFSLAHLDFEFFMEPSEERNKETTCPKPRRTTNKAKKSLEA